MNTSRNRRPSAWSDKQFLVTVFLLMGTFACALPAPCQTNTFSDAKYGISFQYPEGYVLKAGDLADDGASLGYLGIAPIEFVGRGGVRIVTVVPPGDPYPGTDYGNAFFTVSVGTHLSEGECERFANEGMNAWDSHVVKKIHGIKFHSAMVGSAGLGHQFTGTYYHGFSRGSCYEFAYGLATAGYGSVDGMTQVDAKKVFSIMEGILVTTRMRPRSRQR